MKKMIISAALVCLAGVTYAQKPVAGDVTGEVQLNFQTGVAPIGIFSPDFKARYFLADDMALRLNLGITTSSSSSDYAENSTDTAEIGTLDRSSSTFKIGVGIEKHFAGTTRLSPYVGAAISFSTSSNSADETNVAQDPFTLQYGYAQGVTTTVDGPSSTTFGIGILAGADYYFVDHIYLGIEGGLGFSTTSDGERTSTTVVAQPGVPTTTTTSITRGGSESGIGHNYYAGLCLGFVF